MFTTTTSALTTAPASNSTVAASHICILGFVFGIYASLLALFFSFALNMLLQYLGVGPWKRNYLSECVYLWFSLVAKSMLGW